MNWLVVFVGHTLHYESVVLLPGDTKMWLINTSTDKDAGTSVIGSVPSCPGKGSGTIIVPKVH